MISFLLLSFSAPVLPLATGKRLLFLLQSPSELLPGFASSFHVLLSVFTSNISSVKPYIWLKVIKKNFYRLIKGEELKPDSGKIVLLFPPRKDERRRPRRLFLFFSLFEGGRQREIGTEEQERERREEKEGPKWRQIVPYVSMFPTFLLLIRILLR